MGGVSGRPSINIDFNICRYDLFILYCRHIAENNFPSSISKF